MLEQRDQAKRAVLKYKVHWHVLFTHFPVSFFLISSGFMVLHLFTRSVCFETAAFLSLLAGALLMVPTMISGWLTWKGRYRGMRARIFLAKIRVAFGMIALSLALVSARIVFPPPLHVVWMAMYTVGILFLLAGAMVEGYHGGRLNHR